MEKVRNKVSIFFNINNENEKKEFYTNLEKDRILRTHFIEYTQEKCTYLLAEERCDIPIALGAVWCCAPR